MNTSGSSPETAGPTAPPTSPPVVRLDFKSGGWVLLLSFVLVLVLVGWRLYIIQEAQDWQSGVAPDASVSNNFNLATASVPVNLIGNRRLPDGSKALVQPAPISQATVDALNSKKWTKYLVAEDRVIGVTINGESRAYPTRVLTWHEVANDTLGGVPIAVTYCPFSGGAAVYDRRLGDREVELRISGLVYNSNLLLYDYHGDRAEESLWSQLAGRAISGPAAAEKAQLEPLACQLVYWKDWVVEQPNTTVMSGDQRLVKQYRTDPYLNYGLSRIVPFPYLPQLPEGEEERVKEPMLVVKIGSEQVSFSEEQIAKNLDSGGSWRTTVGTTPVVIYQRKDKRLGTCSWVHSLDAQNPVTSARFMYRFAWHAFFGEGAATTPTQRP